MGNVFCLNIFGVLSVLSFVFVKVLYVCLRLNMYILDVKKFVEINGK